MRKVLIYLLVILYIFLTSCGSEPENGWEADTTVAISEETTVAQPVETQVISYRDPELNYLFFDDCDSLEEHEWVLSGVSDQVIIADSKNENQMIQVESGTFGIYADRETGTYASMSKNVEIGDGPWTFEVRMDIEDLLHPSSNKEWRGLVFDIFANSKRFYIALNADGYLYGQQGNANTQKPLRVEGLSGYNTWRFIYNGASKVYVMFNGKLIGQFEGTWSTTDAPDGVHIRNVPLNIESGINRVIIDHIGFSLGDIPDWIESDPRITFINAMPRTDSSDILLTAKVSNIQSDWISDGKTQINLFLMSGNDVISESVVKLTSNNAYIHMNSMKQTGMLKLNAFLVRDNGIINEYSRKLYIPEAVQIVPKGGQITSVPGQTYLFDQMERIENYEDGGWKLVHYKYNGNDELYYALDSKPSTGELEIPVEVVGWFGVVLGYLNGAQNIGVDLGEGFTDLQVENTIFLPKDEIGESTVKEVFLGAANFTGQRIKLRAVNPKKARVVYIKFVGLTDEQIAVYQAPSDGVKRAAFNNDGYSDFGSGYYPDTQSLLQRAVDVYKNGDVGVLEFCMGTTFALNHNSEIAGKPFESISQHAKDHLMRDVDKTGVNQIMNFSRSNIIPVQEVALRADEYGIKTFASLRMNAFYDPATYPWLNGNLYDQYVEYRIKTATGAYTKNISYASQTIRDLITEILVEVASFEGVDGVNLDFNRYPDCLGYEDELVEPFIEEYGFDPRGQMDQTKAETWISYKAGIFNDFMKHLRERIPDKEISVRIPETGWKSYGFDLQTWIDNSYIDILIPSTVGYETFFDIKPFVELVRDSDVLLYGGINHYLAGHDMTKQEEDLIKKGVKVDLGHSYVTPEQYLERAWVLYQEGCDGIHVFNNWRGTDIIGLIGNKQAVEKWYEFEYSVQAKGENVIIEKVN